MISEIYCKFKVLIYIELQIKIAMITEDKNTEIFCMADDFCKFFDAMVAKYTLKPTGKRKYHRDSTMSKAEVMLIKREFDEFTLVYIFRSNSASGLKCTWVVTFAKH
ncbi:hypothetical protein HMPREF1870_00799 [Bacteroidales bacterium KA00344]|nr:hypothetical protein HMPREF1870_00799 [Bacteroidales bacterium KA00344]